MAGPAPTEIQSIPTGENAKIVHLPTQERKWRERVVQHVQKKIGPSFTTNEATPHATQPIPDSQALKQARAERVGAEPDIKLADVTHTVGSTIQEVFGGTNDTTHIRTAQGRTPISMLKGRLFRKAA
ncbi:hypothetical protein HYU45_00565 [Candidatus Daviesbacteria bacterium]|nr:hypothetical protein [Candidatus Daviesbacteria bacterium]